MDASYFVIDDYVQEAIGNKLVVDVNLLTNVPSSPLKTGSKLVWSERYNNKNLHETVVEIWNTRVRLSTLILEEKKKKGNVSK